VLETPDGEEFTGDAYAALARSPPARYPRAPLPLVEAR
jgi:hypothetical protein